MANRKSAVQQVQQASAQSATDKDFENHLNRILKSYRNQGTLLRNINQLQSNSSQLARTLNANHQQILNNKLNQYKILLKTSGLYSGIISSLRTMYNYLSQNDDTIKSSALNLGLSRSLSDQYRNNLVESSKFAARLGMSIGQMTKGQETFTAETGQSLLLSKESLEAITLIAQGTNLGAENAGKLAGQFKLLGINAKNSEKFVTSTLKQTGKLGVNLNKVLNDISTNFDSIQSFNF